jgi:NAD(P)-dependent dehydrogenase (short-subunit alcohol dehydrogenase family)
VKVLLIGGTGHVGSAARAALSERNTVLVASRTGDLAVDVTDPPSIEAALEKTGTVDAIVVCVGSVPYKPLEGLTRDDFLSGLANKAMGQIEVVQRGTRYLSDGGSFTLTTGVLAREPIATGVAASVANGAVEAFVMAAAVELPRAIRINAVSPTVLEEATEYHSSFPGFPPVPSSVVGQAYVKSVEGLQTGRVFAV